MQISRLLLHNIRCYRDLALELPAGLGIFVGPNASGKTSLLEAVYLLATSASPRTSQDREIVQWEARWGSVSGQFRLANRRPVELSVALLGQRASDPALTEPLPASLRGAKAATVDGRLCGGLGDLLGVVEAVFFSPDDLQTVKGPPALRRRLMNAAIAQMKPRYLDDLSRYRRALRQRNELLKRGGAGAPSGAELAPWTSLLCQAGAQIAQDRAEFVAQLQQQGQGIHERLSGSSDVVGIAYSGDLENADDVDGRRVLLQEQLESAALAERKRGTTLVGPHRDDIALTLGGMDVRQFGSQGQQRTMALTLKLAEACVMRERRGEAPVLLLDDCLSELDPDRSRRILELTSDFEQILLTTATPEIGAASIVRKASWFGVERAQVMPLPAPPLPL